MTATSKSNPVEFRSVVTSQWGEDGIIAEVFRRIGAESEVCVEFGAWDGKHLSNTWDLWHNKGWSAILIEADKNRCHALRESLRDYPRVRAHNAFVSIEGENSLDHVLAKLGTPAQFDLLSIDVDGDDYYIFQRLERFSPRVVLVEYNPTIPPEIDLVQVPGEYCGASALALVRLAREKGYTFVCCTETNCLFVLTAEFPKLGIPEPALSEVFPRTHLTYVITSYGGLTYVSHDPLYAFPKPATLWNVIRGQLRARRDRHPKLAVRDGEKVSAVRMFWA